jgi:hypothetical protein
MGDVRPKSGDEPELPDESHEQMEHHPAPAEGGG